MDKYVIYLRKSRADEEAEQSEEEDTLSRHRRILTDLAFLYMRKRIKSKLRKFSLQ